MKKTNSQQQNQINKSRLSFLKRNYTKPSVGEVVVDKKIVYESSFRIQPGSNCDNNGGW